MDKLKINLRSADYMRNDIAIYEPNPEFKANQNVGSLRTIWTEGYPLDQRHADVVNLLLNILSKNNLDFHTEVDRELGYIHSAKT